MTFTYAGWFLAFTHAFFDHEKIWQLWYFKQMYFQLKICLFFIYILNNYEKS